jgi:hypothetical protein
VSNATETEERVNAGFAALLEELRAIDAPRPEDAAKATAAALERAQARVRHEYAEHDLVPPSPFALSITARRVMAELDAERNGKLPVDQPAREAAE